MLITYSKAYRYHTFPVLAPQGITRLLSFPQYTYNSIRQAKWINTCHIPLYTDNTDTPPNDASQRSPFALDHFNCFP